ncbi:WD40-repeat-containing domain protein [Schizophyllum amplum]|uniref:WD40-repeat-containing domain protein n=1 Tax=Schizophyllum amplum TaxID=97359 RepID=A0A550BY89_9AGAR|nr:WD40-repeat-containing domain protein [Auriculariopsis ampla]
MTSLRTYLPIVTAQPSFPDVVREVDDGMIPNEKIWVSCYTHKWGKSIHAKIDVTLDAHDRSLVRFNTVEGDVKLEKDARGIYSATCPSLNIPPTSLALPRQEYADPERANPQKPHRITALAAAPDGSTFATGFLDGSIHLYPVSAEGLTQPPTSPPFRPYDSPSYNTPPKQVSRAHKSTVAVISYFASSRAILSSGGDFTLHVHPTGAALRSSTSQPAGSSTSRPTPLTPTRTLTGHARAVTGARPLGPTGALSASMDGTVRVWDVEAGEQAGMHIAATGVAALASASNNTEALVALADGRAQLIDLRAAEATGDPSNSSSSAGFTTPRPNAFGAGSAIAAHGHVFAMGSSRGVVALYDRRRPDVPLAEFARNEGEGAAVESLVFLDDGRLAVATADGLPFIASLNIAAGSRSEDPTVERELIGADCDAVRCLSWRAGELWAGGDDGVVRRYMV